MQAVFDLLATDQQTYTLDCPGVTYAYCGRAQCHMSGEDGLAACGCRLVPGQLGRFQIDLASAVLLRSAAFREGALLARDGDLDTASARVCGALLDGSLWAEAGFATNLGSFFHPFGGHAASDEVLPDEGDYGGSDLNAPILRRRGLLEGPGGGGGPPPSGGGGGLFPGGSSGPGLSSARGLHGSCMGAPCLSSLEWNAAAGCSVTCMCPDYRNPDDDTSLDGCFENGVLPTIDYRALVWAVSLDSVLGYAGVLAQTLAGYDAAKLASLGTCNECTVV
jgi:hypothetical protein